MVRRAVALDAEEVAAGHTRIDDAEIDAVRADTDLRVDLVAARFQGGGHACAAGLSVKAPPADFEAQLLAAMAERLAKPPAPAA